MVAIALGNVKVCLTDLHMHDLLIKIERRLKKDRGFKLATLNLDHLVKLKRDTQFYSAYAEHDIIVADGMPIAMLARLFGAPARRIAGADLILPLMQLAQKRQWNIAFIGTSWAVLKSLEGRFAREFPSARVIISASPSMGFDPLGAEAQALIRQISDAQIDLCFLALGAPKQEVFAQYAFKTNPKTGFVSIGAGLDFLTGAQKRAPKWMQSCGLEWSWRLWTNPTTMTTRYIRCAVILPRLFWSTLRGHYRNKKAAA